MKLGSSVHSAVYEISGSQTALLQNLTVAFIVQNPLAIDLQNGSLCFDNFIAFILCILYTQLKYFTLYCEI